MSLPPSRPPLSNSGVLLATWFGAGYLPKAPGTWGSLAALPIGWVIHGHWGVLGLIAACILVFGAGVWASNVYIGLTNEADPGPVVVDEVVGQWLTLLVASTTLFDYALAFVLFRAADIIKPWPVSWADREIKGGLGVMLDDVLAAGYATAALAFVKALMGSGG